jgi:hypothetical protein
MEFATRSVEVMQFAAPFTSTQRSLRVSINPRSRGAGGIGVDTILALEAQTTQQVSASRESSDVDQTEPGEKKPQDSSLGEAAV